MARAIGWLTMYVGLEFVYRRGAAMAHRAADLLAAIDGVTLLTPRDRMAGLVSFQIAGWEPQAALDELSARTFCDRPDAAARSTRCGSASASGRRRTSSDRFLDGVRLLAAHTPETIPPRRTLTILNA